MVPSLITDRLPRFAKERGFKGKGPLCVALVVTQHARDRGIPLESAELITAGGGQVLGLGRNAVQAVLERHGIRRVLAKEGGRTSRGSLGKMREYVAFLNDAGPDVDIDLVEKFWIDRVTRFFAGQPFRLSVDGSKGVHAIVSDLIRQARRREQDAVGVSYSGAMVQHLVGATLACLRDDVLHNSYSTADAPSGRAGDFVLGDVAIHVTMSPGEALIDRCVQNLAEGYRPVLITLKSGVIVAYALAARRIIDDRIDVLDIHQFLTTKIYEMGGFTSEGRHTALRAVVERYNGIIDDIETDPSMKIIDRTAGAKGRN